MDKSYYKSYFTFERNHWWFMARSEILKSYIQKNIASRKLRILNVGVATGATTTMLQQFGEVVSLEYEKDCIDFVRDKVDFDIIQGSILELPFKDNEFDLVCAFDVIEHVEDDRLATREMARVCTSGGSVLVTVPAYMSLWSEHDEINHHMRRYTKETLQHTFASLAQGAITFSSYFNTILFPAIYAVRRLSGLLPKRKSSRPLISDFEKFKPGVLNSLLFNVMKSERKRIVKAKSFPAGVSLILHWKKN